MNKQFQAILQQLVPIAKLLNRYLVLGVFLIFTSIYGGLVLRINGLAASEPSQAQVDEKNQTIERPRVDQATVTKIQQLQNQNIQVKALFDEARKNPFAE